MKKIVLTMLLLGFMNLANASEPSVYNSEEIQKNIIPALVNNEAKGQQEIINANLNVISLALKANALSKPKTPQINSFFTNFEDWEKARGSASAMTKAWDNTIARSKEEDELALKRKELLAVQASFRLAQKNLDYKKQEVIKQLKSKYTQDVFNNVEFNIVEYKRIARNMLNMY